MRKYLLILLTVISLLFLCSCKNSSTVSDVTTNKSASSTFSIQFIDVGQGDSALVECDGHYMLIDGGDKLHGDKVYSTLEEKGIQHLDILAISHLHEDHIGGLIKALTYATKIDKVIANADYRNNATFRELENELGTNGAQISVPSTGEKFKLGSAEVEVADVAAVDDNDALVLMITYGQTRFLFTGDIEYNAQKRLYERYNSITKDDEPYKIDLIKMPHHGSYEESLYTLMRTFMPDYVIFSVGEGNPYGHPHSKTLDMLDNPKSDYHPKLYRTDKDGDITVKSDGKKLTFKTSK